MKNETALMDATDATVSRGFKMKNVATLAVLFAAIAMPEAQAEVSILDDNINNGLDSSSDTAARDVAGSQWSEETGGGWAYGRGNSWIYSDQTTEGGLVRTIALGGLGLTTEDQLDITITYGAWGGTVGQPGADDLYVHVWGLKDVSSTGTSGVADLTGLGGNGALYGDQTDYADFTRYNLADGSVLNAYNDSTSSTAAYNIQNHKLSDTNDGTQSTISFSLNSAGAIADYDYLVIGFARDVDVSTSEQFALKYATVDAIPEPGTYALIGGLFALAHVMLRRRRA